MERVRGVLGSVRWAMAVLVAAALLLWPLVAGPNGAGASTSSAAVAPGRFEDDDHEAPPRIDDHDDPGIPVALPAPSPGGDGAAADRPTVRRADLAVRSSRIPRPIPGRRLAAERTESAARPEPCRPLACPTRGPPRA